MQGQPINSIDKRDEPSAYLLVYTYRLTCQVRLLAKWWTYWYLKLLPKRYLIDLDIFVCCLPGWDVFMCCFSRCSGQLCWQTGQATLLPCKYQRNKDMKTPDKPSQEKPRISIIKAVIFSRMGFEGCLPDPGASSDGPEACTCQVSCIYNRAANKAAASRCASGSGGALKSFWWWKSSYTLSSNVSAPLCVCVHGRYSGLCTRTVYLCSRTKMLKVNRDRGSTN